MWRPPPQSSLPARALANAAAVGARAARVARERQCRRGRCVARRAAKTRRGVGPPLRAFRARRPARRRAPAADGELDGAVLDELHAVQAHAEAVDLDVAACRAAREHARDCAEDSVLVLGLLCGALKRQRGQVGGGAVGRGARAAARRSLLLLACFLARRKRRLLLLLRLHRPAPLAHGRVSAARSRAGVSAARRTASWLLLETLSCGGKTLCTPLGECAAGLAEATRERAVSGAEATCQARAMQRQEATAPTEEAGGWWCAAAVVAAAHRRSLRKSHLTPCKERFTQAACLRLFETVRSGLA